MFSQIIDSSCYRETIAPRSQSQGATLHPEVVAAIATVSTHRTIMARLPGWRNVEHGHGTQKPWKGAPARLTAPV